MNDGLDHYWQNESRHVEQEQIWKELFGFVKLRVHDLLDCLEVVELGIYLFLMHHLSKAQIIKNILKILQIEPGKLLSFHLFVVLGIFHDVFIQLANFLTEWDLLEVDKFVLDLDHIFMTCSAGSKLEAML